MGKKVKFNGEMVDWNKELLTKEQWEKIDDYFIIGRGIKTIAEEFNISVNFIQQYFYQFLESKKRNRVPITKIIPLTRENNIKVTTIIGHKKGPYYKTEEEELYYLEPKYTWESLSRQEQAFYLKYKPKV